MNFAYWWSFIGKALRLQPPQQACFTDSALWDGSVIESQCPSVCMYVGDIVKHSLPNICMWWHGKKKGAFIRNGRGSQCLQYAEFLKGKLIESYNIKEKLCLAVPLLFLFQAQGDVPLRYKHYKFWQESCLLIWLPWELPRPLYLLPGPRFQDVSLAPIVQCSHLNCTLQCSILHCSAVQNNTLQHSAVHSTVQCPLS